MTNKKVLITGGTAGIGKVAARELAYKGAHVVIVGRNPKKTEATVRELRFCACSPKIDYLIGDLSVQADVRRVADEYRQQHDRLDVLINNAGALFMKREVSADGLEMSFALNHLAYFTLTYNLLDLLKASAPARIINVTSSSHFIGSHKLNDLDYQNGYLGLLAYGRSKLMNVIFTYELTRRLDGSGVTANCLHPGLIGSDFGSNNNGFYRPAFKLYQRIAPSPEKGAETIIYLASHPEVQDVSGKYFVNKTAVRSSKTSYNPEFGRQLWDLSLKVANLDGPEARTQY